ncbi:MAG: hypothetical protein CMA37_00195 [Euryarchaeota archaeon]|nr:hypothetical protein [Euryarchaeota archaeon]
MASPNRGVLAFALSLLFLLSGPLSQFSLPHAPVVELDSSDVFSSGSTDYSEVSIPGPNSLGIGPSLDMDPTHALQTISFSVGASNDVRATGFDWDDWDLSGFSKQGLKVDEDGALLLGFQGIDWNFDKNSNGWTSSSTSYAQRNTATTCGMSGANGASWWTRGAAVTVTSPQVSLAGYTGLSVQAWIKQGTYGCGEEPDNNENFYLEYKNSNNGWTQIQYLPGSTTGGSVTNVNFNLPSDAYHSSFQIRARQNAGSGTCCDYWFFDDVIIPGTSGANLTTRSFGWSSNADEQIEEGRYSPVYLDAVVPEDAHLNWTVIDADTNSPIPGLVNRTGKWVDLSVVDWKTHKSLRLQVQFSSNLQGESPKLFGISGGGKIHDSFNSNPEDQGWSLRNSSWSESSSILTGGSNSTIETPILDINMPYASYKFQTSTEGNVTTSVSVDGGTWVELSPSAQRVELNKPASTIQFQYTGSSQTWSIEDIEVQLYPTHGIVNPRIDIDSDGRNEWSVTDDGIGTWGNQDVFLDGNTSTTLSVGFNPTSWHSVLIPEDAKSFHVSVADVGSVGLGVQTLALWVGNTMIAQTGGNGFVDGLRLSLNESELEMLNFETQYTTPIKIVAGTEFIHARIELISDAGTHQLSGLSIGYDAENTVYASEFDELVLAINRVRLDTSKAGSMPLNFYADSACSLNVSIISTTSSGDVAMGSLSWNNESTTITPSNMWREPNTRFQVHTSSPHRLIVNMYSDDKSAMWFIPVGGGNPIAMGDHDVLIFSESGMSHSESSGIHDLQTSFRTSQSFDDQSYMRFETRVQLANGVVSMPAIQTWTHSAIDNDLMIQSMSMSTDRGLLAPSSNYLMAEENLTIHVDVGFENGDTDEKPFHGEFELQLTKNDEVIANTTGYDGDEWVVETKTPFTSGNLTYEVILTPLAGGQISGSQTVNRTFIIDPLAPVVTGSNIRYFDHLQTSTNQQITINISDQPALPTDVTLMLWTEWANDYDGDGWPSAGEYIPRQMSNPTELDYNFGLYEVFIDDTAAYPGEKVAGYVVGRDPSGHLLLGGGSETVDDHLFMYQIMNDGSPVIDGDGFEWTDGRKAWLHPDQRYELNIPFTEVNGISDIHEITVSLADNIPSDRLTLKWNSTNKQCTSETSHIIIASCRINDRNGLTPDPFDQDLALVLEIIPQWTMPDLGEMRREPSVTIQDRAGNEDIATFPQNRWRFSAEMMITDNPTLWVENGALNEDGARVSPGSNIELSGHLIFAQSGEKPQFDCELEVRINGVKTPTLALGGTFTASLDAPVISGQHAMTWQVDCMPEQGIDVTSQSSAVLWILVDAVGPQVVEFSSPRESSILTAEEHFVKVVISENYGIDVDSVELFWWVTTMGQNDAIVSGSTPLQLVGNESTGLRLEFTGLVDLSVVDPVFLQEQAVLKIRIDGRDFAGNQFERDGNSEAFPAGVWHLIHHKSEISLEQSGVELSKSNLEVDEPTIVQVHIRNDGMLGGDAEVLIEVVNLVGERSQLARSSVFVEAESVYTLVVDWKPDAPGMQRIEVTLGETTDKTEFVDVTPTKERGFLEDAIGATNPWILGTTLTMIFVGLLFVLSWMRVATAKQGESESESEWEYEDEEFDDEDFS